MRNKLKNMLASHYFEGILLAVCGIIMLLFPSAAFRVISIIFGLILFLLGALLSFEFVFRHKDQHPLLLFAGLLCLAIGLELVIHTDQFSEPVHVVLSITLIYSAILLFMQAYELRHNRAKLFYITIGFAVAAIIFAVLMLINDENSTAFLRIKGISMIIEGVASLFVIQHTLH